MQIDFQSIEARWKKHWEDAGTYRVSNDSDKPKYYVLDMFPYPSGAGLHVGHPLGYIGSDIVSRYKRMDGHNVLHPMGYDAFGLPAEQYAIQTGIHPAVSTNNNIEKFRAQLINLGLSYDWSREVKTCDPGFYKWTQWIFLQLYGHFYDNDREEARPIDELITRFVAGGNTTAKETTANSDSRSFDANGWADMSPKEKDEVLMDYRLAYKSKSYVNWCEALGTVLANDEVKDGVSERGGYPVERKAMEQWSLRITAYAERLLNDLDALAWSDSMKAVQRNWIGRSEGAEVFFQIAGHQDQIQVFTTRPDTIFGATFMVMAPEHPLVDAITTAEQRETIDEYKKYVSTRTERERLAEVKEMTGAFTGAYAINPFSEEQIPIWIADYVLYDYGTGAIMAVPSDDHRDNRFATTFGLKIIDVVDRSDYPDADVEDKVGTMINSGLLNGLQVPEAITTIIREIENRGIGKKRVQYKMRDAIYSRQRYWGEPIPIVYDKDGVSHALDADKLPLELPMLTDFEPGSGQAPLARATDWVNTSDGRTRETDTMPGYAGSSWYFLRYMDPGNSQQFASPAAVNYWKDVDLYIGGTEHAVGHLMYSRFWHKFLFDKGLVPTNEPFKRLINQGMIQGVIEYLYMRKEKVDGKLHFVSADMVRDDEKDALVRIAVPVEFVKGYGSADSHLDLDGIQKLAGWRPEYAEAVFEFAGGAVTKESTNENCRILTESEIGKMGKRYHNAVNPDTVVGQYGADCFRMYEMFLGPIEQSKPWDTNNIDGVSRFIRRLWSLYFDESNQLAVTQDDPSPDELTVLHQCILRVRDDVERYSFNTCISHFMTAVNELKKLNSHSRAILDPFVRLIAPFAPFISEEIWHKLGHSGSVHHAAYPVGDESHLVQDTVSYPVCINGKKRSEIEFASDTSRDKIEEAVLELEAVQKWIEGKPVKKVIIVPDRMINVVV